VVAELADAELADVGPALVVFGKEAFEKVAGAADVYQVAAVFGEVYFALADVADSTDFAAVGFVLKRKDCR
jgi:hypothetical protein